MPLDYAAARELLEGTFGKVEQHAVQGRKLPQASQEFERACDRVFASRTQAYREALLGCAVARVQDDTINVRLPYVGHGADAFNGRTLDERVINPFLREHRIPSSKGAYLSTFRRSVQFVPETKVGVRDRVGYDAFLECLSELEDAGSDKEKHDLLAYLLHRFVVLRDASAVTLVRVQRMSLEQYDAPIAKLLSTPSGGRFPVLLAVATFLTLKECFNPPWEVSWQGINVADAASGAGGDITLSEGGRVIMAAEVTERVVDRARVTATFTTKIAETGIEDYLFFAKPSEDSQARRQAQRYFAQGHEINFVDLQQWIHSCLVSVGSRGRSVFNQALSRLIDDAEVPAALKVAWNNHVTAVVSGDPPSMTS
jgi:hypothetical protein